MERQTHPDKRNALSMIEAAEKQIKFTLSLGSSDDSAFTIIRNVYECFRSLGDALLVLKGLKSNDHTSQIKELETLNVNTKRSIKLLENLKKLRHNINYYGYEPKKIEADDAISFSKDCFEPYFRAVKKTIENSNAPNRLIGSDKRLP